MESIIRLLMEISVTSAVLIAAVLLIRRAFAKNMSPVLMLLLWGMVLLRLLLPVTFTSPLHISGLLPEKQAVQEDVADDAALDTAMPIYSAQDNTNNPVSTYENTGFGEAAALETETAAAQPKKNALTLDEILKKIPVWHLLIAVWAAGAAAVLAYSLRKAALFGRKLRFCKPVTDKELLCLVNRYKKTAGVRRKITVLECDMVQVPAVFGYVNPKILVPSAFLYDMDSKMLEAILLHELLHIRANDILKSYIWLAAKALHWFNPLVWLAYKRYTDDVEIMRDQKAAECLKQGGAFEYSRSLLEAARQANDKSKTPAVATALFEDKQRLKQRIVCLVKPRKKKKAYVVITAVLTLVLAVSCFTTACQPTPEEPAVVGKGEFEDIIAQEQTENEEEQEPAITEPYEAPESWTESVDMKGSDVEVNVDAVITVPDVSAYPVYEVVKSNFTQQQIDDLMDYFVQDKVIMQAPEMTKADYQEMLIEAKRGQLIDGEYVVNEGSLAWVEEVEEMIRNAPETSEPQVVTNRSIEGDGFGGAVVLEDGKYGSVFASERMFDYCIAGYPVPESQKLGMYGTGVEGELNISQQEAVEKAQELFSELGISNMKAVDIEKAELISRTGIKIDVETPKLESKGYFIKFALSIDGIDTVLIEGGGYHKGETFDYSAPWTPEWIKVYIDEDGNVGYFNWRGPLKLTEKVSENVTLKSFEDMQERIRAQMLYECGFYEGSSEKITVTVDSIEMKMTLVSVKNEPNKAMYVPSWYIYYTVTRHGNFTDESGEKKSEWPSEERLVLNAIDAGVVLPFRIPADLSNAEDVAAAEDEIAESLN